MMHVKNLKIDGDSTARTTASPSSTASLSHCASGSIKNVTLTDIAGSLDRLSVTGARSSSTRSVSASQQSVEIVGNVVSSYNKNGIDVRGNVDAKIVGNTVTGSGPADVIAQNGIVVRTGALGARSRATPSAGTSYTPTDVEATGILVIDATGVNMTEAEHAVRQRCRLPQRRYVVGRQDQRLEQGPRGSQHQPLTVRHDN